MIRESNVAGCGSALAIPVHGKRRQEDQLVSYWATQEVKAGLGYIRENSSLKAKPKTPDKSNHDNNRTCY